MMNKILLLLVMGLSLAGCANNVTQVNNSFNTGFLFSGEETISQQNITTGVNIISGENYSGSISSNIPNKDSQTDKSKPSQDLSFLSVCKQQDDNLKQVLQNKEFIFISAKSLGEDMIRYFQGDRKKLLAVVYDSSFYNPYGSIIGNQFAITPGVRGDNDFRQRTLSLLSGRETTSRLTNDEAYISFSFDRFASLVGSQGYVFLKDDQSCGIGGEFGGGDSISFGQMESSEKKSIYKMIAELVQNKNLRAGEKINDLSWYIKPYKNGYIILSPSPLFVQAGGVAQHFWFQYIEVTQSQLHVYTDNVAFLTSEDGDRTDFYNGWLVGSRKKGDGTFPRIAKVKNDQERITYMINLIQGTKKSPYFTKTLQQFENDVDYIFYK